MLFTRVSGEDRAPGPLRGTVGSQSPPPPPGLLRLQVLLSARAPPRNRQ